METETLDRPDSSTYSEDPDANFNLLDAIITVIDIAAILLIINALHSS